VSKTTSAQAQNRWVTRMEASAASEGRRRDWATAARRRAQDGGQARARNEARRRGGPLAAWFAAYVAGN
jgi:membrane-bound ClpP family serine protease